MLLEQIYKELGELLGMEENEARRFVTIELTIEQAQAIWEDLSREWLKPETQDFMKQLRTQLDYGEEDN